MPIKICHNCEKEFRSKRYPALFCSFACRSSLPLGKKLAMVGYDLSPTGCWLWRGYITAEGYGRVGCGGKYFRVHRASWQVHRGPIPDGMDVLHSCDVRHCFNPDCLFLGNDADNIADMDAKGRRHVHRGEENGQSVLTAAQATDIRSRPRVFGSGVAIAEEFGISPSLVSLIRLGRVWRHV